MTLTDLQTLALTDEGREKIRVMVAELSGLEIIGYADSIVEGQPAPLYGSVDGPCWCPNYTTSLDTCAEFEAGLTERSERIRYQNTLAEVTTVNGDVHSLESEFAHMCASALHRAIAFILTKQATKGAE